MRLCRSSQTIQTNFYRHVRLASRDNNKLFGVVALAPHHLGLSQGSSPFTSKSSTHCTIPKNPRVLGLKSKKRAATERFEDSVSHFIGNGGEKSLLQHKRGLQTKLTESVAVEPARRRKTPRRRHWWRGRALSIAVCSAGGGGWSRCFLWQQLAVNSIF